MRARHRTGLVTLATLIGCLALPLQYSLAKGGGGKGGHGKGHAHAGGGRAKHGGPGFRDGFSGGRGSTHAARPGGRGRWSIPTDDSGWSPRGFDDAFVPRGDTQGAHPWSMQRANEALKRDHRLSVADKLDQLADRNGNSNLHETAERMREKAWEHYEKRLDKIDSKDSGLLEGNDGWLGDDAGWDDLPGFDSPGDKPFSGQQLTGRENALFRQLQNEQRNLANRMETAQRLWDAYEQSGDELLADTARAFEERALAQFENRMDAISDFQRRFGLPTPAGIEPTTIGPGIVR